MPKIVNHEERKEVIAKATWKVIAREGMKGATVRSIAKEAGLSLGAVRYYFHTQDELLVFAMELVEQRVTERVQQHLKEQAPIKEQIVHIFLELLPISSEHLIEMQVWLEYVSYKVRNQQVTEDSILKFINMMMNYLQDEGLLKREIHIQDEVDHLHAFLDGLALHVLLGTIPMDQVRLRTLIEREINRIIKEEFDS